MDLREEALLAHERWRGTLEIVPNCPLNDAHDLSVA